MRFSGRKNKFTGVWVRFALAVSMAGLGMQTVSIMPAMAAQQSTASQSIRLPLYPHAGKEPYATIAYGEPGSQNLKAGSARYVVRANLDQVKSWYLTKMPLSGYRLDSNQIGPNGYGRQLSFVAKHNAGLTVTLILRRLPRQPKDTVIYYDVTDMTEPAKSAASTVPSDATKVFVEYVPATVPSTSGVNEPAAIDKTVTNFRVISALVRAVNQLPVDIRTQVGNPMYQGGATLRFVTRSGEVTVVKVEMGVNRVVVGKTPPLFDLQNSVWQLVSKDMGEAPYPARR